MALSSLHLHELAFVFGILGNIVSFGVYLAPLPTFWRIYKMKSTEGFQSIPYAVALFSAMLLLFYAFVKDDNTTMIVTINAIGFAIEAFYLTVYLVYAPKKARVYTAKILVLFNMVFYGVIVVTSIVFVHGGHKHNILSRGGDREKVVGWICAIFSVSVFAAPLSVMRMVIRTKSVEYMPFWLSFSLTLCAVMWFFYGFLIHDFYIALPNVLGFLFGLAQMALYVMYKDAKKPKEVRIKFEEDDLKQRQDLAVDIIKLGSIEMTESGDVTAFRHRNDDVRVIDVNVEETRVSDNVGDQNDVIERVMGADEEVPRCVSSV